MKSDKCLPTIGTSVLERDPRLYALGMKFLFALGTGLFGTVPLDLQADLTLVHGGGKGRFGVARGH